MATVRNNRELRDSLIKLSLYVENNKRYVIREFKPVVEELTKQYKILISDIKYNSLDGMTKKELLALIVKLRKINQQVYNEYTQHLLDMLASFMKSVNTVSLIMFASHFQTDDEDDSEEVPAYTKRQALDRAESESKNNTVIFGLAALTTMSTLWSKLTNVPIAANGLYIGEFIGAFGTSSQAQIESLIKQCYVNNWTKDELIENINVAFGRIENQNSALVNTAMQHIFQNTNANAMSAFTKSYRWVSVLDGRTSAICRSRNGHVYKFGSGVLPPAHINCRSHIEPVNDDVYNQLKLLDWMNQQSSELADDIGGIFDNEKFVSTKSLKPSDLESKVDKIV